MVDLAPRRRRASARGYAPCTAPPDMTVADHALWSRAPGTRPSRGVTRAVRVVVALLVLLGLVALAALVAARTNPGRRWVARRVEALVTSQIRGSLHIASIDRIGWRSVTARGVRFVAPNNDEVIAVDHVDMDFLWGPLLRGRLVSPRATAHGGRVLLHDGAHGDLSIDVTMQSRDPSKPSRPASSTPRNTVEFQRLDVDGIDFAARVDGVPDARVTGVRGLLRITVHDPGGALLLTLDDLAGSGRLDTPSPIRLRLTGGTFRYDSASRDERVRADTRAVLGDDRVRLHCRARVRDDGPHVAVRLGLPRSAGPLDNLGTLVQATVASMTSSHFDFSVSHD